MHANNFDAPCTVLTLVRLVVLGDSVERTTKTFSRFLGFREEDHILEHWTGATILTLCIDLNSLCHRRKGGLVLKLLIIFERSFFTKSFYFTFGTKKTFCLLL